MSRVNPFREPLQPVVEKTSCKDGRIVPQSRSWVSDERSPAAATKPQYDCRHVHPSLKEVKPADVSLPIGRDGQDQNEKERSNQNQPLRRVAFPTRAFHDQWVRARPSISSLCAVVSLHSAQRAASQANSASKLVIWSLPAA